MPSTATNGSSITAHYRASSTKQALDLEREHAAHNYHPLPVVFAKASGVHVWDPEVCAPASSCLPPLLSSSPPPHLPNLHLPRVSCEIYM